ncbi:g3764 [Coccomyxa viridis]|uniref:G3764 protein n=1 Tax=Coccomyxa viridis TaxID=1274662 RepID=A0ABP1FNN2_9CHLO
MPRPQERPLKVNTKKLTRAQHKMECMGELTAFFSCMTRYRFQIDGTCDKEKDALAKCAAEAAKQTKQRNTTNYHLQRLSRALKR